MVSFAWVYVMYFKMSPCIVLNIVERTYLSKSLEDKVVLPTVPFTISKSKIQEIAKFHSAQERRA